MTVAPDGVVADWRCGGQYRDEPLAAHQCYIEVRTHPGRSSGGRQVDEPQLSPPFPHVGGHCVGDVLQQPHRDARSVGTEATQQRWQQGPRCGRHESQREPLIQRCFIYLDPDYAGQDTARYPWLDQH